MGGHINVSSQYGMGSIFVVTIPQKVSRYTGPSTSEKTYPNMLENQDKECLYCDKKVLIVDDNKLNIKVAKKALSSFDFQIDEAYDGEECLNLINSGKTYDLILMDIMMPNMSGTAALQKLKERSDFNTPVIALTADALSNSKEKYLNLGFKNYIAKPFNKEEIKKVIDEIFKY